MAIYRGTAAVAFVLAVGACTEASAPVIGKPADVQARLVASSATTPFLPVGTRVQPGDSLVAPAEPYDPRRHGAALADKDSMRHAVPLAERERVRETAKLRPGQYQPASAGSAGLDLTNDGEFHGIYAVFDAESNFELPLPLAGTETVLYSPTMYLGYPEVGSCVEVTGYHSKISGIPTRHWIGFWDWCGENTFVKTIDLTNATDRGKYVRVYNGKPTVTISVVTVAAPQSPRCWYAHLYNYTAGGHEQIMSSCGVMKNTQVAEIQKYGWLMYESYNLWNSSIGACPTLPTIRAMDIQFAQSGLGWSPITNDPTKYAKKPDFDCWSNAPHYEMYFPARGLSANSWEGWTGGN